MKFLARKPDSIRIGKLEIYKIKGKSDWSIIRASCNCLIVGFGRYGFTWLSAKFDCYKKADEIVIDG